MIFTPENCELVLSGAKTMTRRVVKPGEEARFRGDTLYDHTGMVKWQVGRTYAIQPGRGKKSVGRIKITAIRREKVQDISEEDSSAEGAGRPHRFDDNLYMTYLSFRDGFRQVWSGLYGNDPVKGWEANPDVWVISFELVELANRYLYVSFSVRALEREVNMSEVLEKAKRDYEIYQGIIRDALKESRGDYVPATQLLTCRFSGIEVTETELSWLERITLGPREED